MAIITNPQSQVEPSRFLDLPPAPVVEVSGELYLHLSLVLESIDLAVRRAVAVPAAAEAA